MPKIELKFSHLILMFLCFSGCAHLSSPKEAIELKIKGKKGDIEISLISLSRETQYYEKGELSQRSIRNLTLKIKSEIDFIEGENFWIHNTTVEKKGNEALHGFGFPELRETIKLKLNPKGRVLEVEGYPKDSAFYLPPVMLPLTNVRMGEMWEETFHWNGEGQPVFLKTTIQCTLDSVQEWEKKKVYKITMKAISLLEEEDRDNPDFTFKSSSEGYFLWDNEKGSVVYAQSTGRDEVRSLKDKNLSVTITQFTSKTIP